MNGWFFDYSFIDMDLSLKLPKPAQGSGRLSLILPKLIRNIIFSHF